MQVIPNMTDEVREWGRGRDILTVAPEGTTFAHLLGPGDSPEERKAQWLRAEQENLVQQTWHYWALGRLNVCAVEARTAEEIEEEREWYRYLDHLRTAWHRARAEHRQEPGRPYSRPAEREEGQYRRWYYDIDPRVRGLRARVIERMSPEQIQVICSTHV